MFIFAFRKKKIVLLSLEAMAISLLFFIWWDLLDFRHEFVGLVLFNV